MFLECRLAFHSVVCCAKTTDSSKLNYDLVETEHYEEWGNTKLGRCEDEE